MTTKANVDDLYQVVNLMMGGHRLQDALSEAGVSPLDWHRGLQADAKLQAEYEAAKVVLSDLMASELVQIADREDVEVGRAANMMKARMWLASKWNVKGYGDRMDVNVTKVVDIGLALQDARERVRAIDVESRVVEEAERVLIGEIKGDIK